MVYDPALTRVRTSEPRLERLLDSLRACPSGRLLLNDATKLGFRTGDDGIRPVILPLADRGSESDLESFVWQVERQRQPLDLLSNSYREHFSELSHRAAKRAEEIFSELNEAPQPRR